jgi:anti-sigma B factor antagonist
MPVKMTNREVDGVSVVELDGRIVLGEESNSLREKLKGLIAEGKKKIVLNMANIKYIDSADLGTLVAGHISAKSQGVSVRLSHLIPRSLADDQAVDRFRCLRHRSSRSRQLPKFLRREQLVANGIEGPFSGLGYSPEILVPRQRDLWKWQIPGPGSMPIAESGSQPRLPRLVSLAIR